MFLGMFLRNGKDGHIQPTADSGGDVFERHSLFCDGVVTGSRCALLQSKQVEACDIRNMRRRPAVVTIANVCRDSLSASQLERVIQTLNPDSLHASTDVPKTLGLRV
jgi:hypothetical protein